MTDSDTEQKRKKKNHKKKYQQTERVKEWNEKIVRVRLREKMKALEERTKGKHIYWENTKMKKSKNEEIKKNDKEKY